MAGRRARIDRIGAILERAEGDMGRGRACMSLSFVGRRHRARGARRDGGLWETSGLGALVGPGC